MGLFSRKPVVDPEVVALRDELQNVRVRLDAAEMSKEMLEAHVRMLNETTKNLQTRASQVDGIARRLHEVEDLRGQVESMDELRAQLARMNELQSQVERIDAVQTKLSALDELNGRIAQLAEQVAESVDDARTAADDARTAKEQTVTLNERISSVSQELANQLTELGRDIDELSSRPATVPAGEPVLAADQSATEEMIEELHESQVRLAAEQARYQIAFRQELAQLADQLRRQPPRA